MINQDKKHGITTFLTPTCFECNRLRHFKPNYPIYLKKVLANERGKQKHNFKKANLTTQGDEDVDFGKKKKKEEILLYLMALEDDEIEVQNQEIFYPSDYRDI